MATRLTVKNAPSATRFCGSSIVQAPTGGRTKKLKHNIATIDVTTAIQSREVAATTRTTSKNVNATVVVFVMCSHSTSAKTSPPRQGAPPPPP